MATPLQYISTLGLSSAWNKWYLVSVNGLHAPGDDVFAPNYLPSYTLGIATEYSNTDFQLFAYDNPCGGLAFMPLGGGAAFIACSSLIDPFVFRFRRVGMVNPNYPVGDINMGPRIGYNIGDQYKHQAYLGLDIYATGVAAPSSQVTWLTADVWAEYILYCSNCNMKRCWLWAGLLEGFRVSETDPTKVYLKLNTSSSPIDPNFVPSAYIKVWAQKSKPLPGATSQNWNFENLAITGVTDDWEIEVTIPSVTNPPLPLPSGQPVTYVNTGDFYMLDIPWQVEDPALLFEYGLSNGAGTSSTFSNNTPNTNIYHTQEQQTSYQATVIGVWIDGFTAAAIHAQNPSYCLPPPGQGFIQEWDYPFVDAANQTSVTLPTTTADADARGESMYFGGSGFQNALKGLSLTNPSSIKLILQMPSNCEGLQNFTANTLTGEFVEVTLGLTTATPGPALHFQIVSHQRFDTVEVNSVPLDNSSYFNLFTVFGPASIAGAALTATQIKLIQRRFWVISEMYSGENNANGSANGLWETTKHIISTVPYSVNGSIQPVTQIVWNATEVSESAFTGTDAIDMYPLRTLDARFRAVMPTSIAGSAVSAYAKFHWYLYNATTRAMYSIVDVQSSNTNSSSFQLTVILNDDFTSKFGANDKIYVLFDPPFTPANNQTYENNFSFAIQTAPSLNHVGNVWGLYMGGYYLGGFYSFQAPLASDLKFCLTNILYGYDNNKPAVYVTTYNTAYGIAAVRHNLTKRNYVYFNDNNLDGILVTRYGDFYWKKNVERDVVRLGYPQFFSASDAIPSDAYLINRAVFSIKPFLPTAGIALPPPFWLITPSGYFEESIYGESVNTTLTRTYGFSSFTDGTAAAVHPMTLPLEYYAPVTNSTAVPPPNISISYPVYFKPGATVTTGLESISTAAKIQTVLAGGTVTPGASAYTATDYQYLTQEQVIVGSGIKDAFCTAEGGILLVYGGDLPAHTKNGDQTQKVADTLAVYLVLSDASGMEWWGSPMLEQPTESSTSEAVEWSLPLVVLTDAEYACSVYESATNNLYIFAYVYANTGTYGNTNNLAIGMYRINLGSLAAGPTPGTTATVYQAVSQATLDPIAYVREPLADINSITASSVPPGSVGVQNDYLIRIIANDFANGTSFFKGASATDVTQVYMDIEQQFMSAKIDDTGTISLYFQNAANGNIYVIFSYNQGRTWVLGNQYDANGNMLTFANSQVVLGAAAPSIFGPMLFYVQGDQLFSKLVYIAGNSPEDVRINNAAPSLPVAGSVAAQRVAVIQEPTGEICVFFMQETGVVRGLVTADQGNTWNSIDNW